MRAQKNINRTHGFTIVELAIVIVIIGLLMSLAVVNVLNTRVQGRDAERQADVEAIARFFEEIYNDSEFWGHVYASYPGIVNTINTGHDSIYQDFDKQALRSPTAADSTPSSLQGAENTNQTPTGIMPNPSVPGPHLDKYVYQPLKSDGTLCQFTSGNPADTCVKFNLFYWDESENTVKKITSRHR